MQRGVSAVRAQRNSISASKLEPLLSLLLLRPALPLFELRSKQRKARREQSHAISTRLHALPFLTPERTWLREQHQDRISLAKSAAVDLFWPRFWRRRPQALEPCQVSQNVLVALSVSGQHGRLQVVPSNPSLRWVRRRARLCNNRQFCTRRRTGQDVPKGRSLLDPAAAEHLLLRNLQPVSDRCQDRCVIIWHVARRAKHCPRFDVWRNEYRWNSHAKAIKPEAFLSRIACHIRRNCRWRYDVVVAASVFIKGNHQ